MDSGDRLRRRRSLQERLGLVCCGSTTWDMEQSTINHEDGNGDDLDDPVEQLSEVINPDEPECVIPSPRMNLAAALAAERSTAVVVGEESMSLEGMKTPARMSLMKLLEEDGEEVDAGGGVCCVCMGRRKGAAFIPCGHTFCRVCSRELWLNRGSCPLCNRSILQILDIF